MPPSLPMWPPVYIAATARPPVAAPTATPLRRRWMIVDESVRQEVGEAEYRNALASCETVEVARYAHEDVITHLCFRTKSRDRG